MNGIVGTPYKNSVYGIWIARRSARLLLLVLLGLANPSWSDSTDSENSLTVNVNVEGVQEKLLKNVLGHLGINEFHDKTAPSAARVRYLHRSAEKQIQTALQPFGYFRASVKSQLEKTATGWQARYHIELGPAIKVNHLDLRVTGEGKSDAAFQKALAESPLKQGAVLNQEAYEALKKRFQVLASERGYFDAKLEDHQIRVDLPNYTASIVLHYETGDRYQLGEVDFQQPVEWLSPSLLQRYVEIQSGQDYEAADLQQLQGDLSNSNYYKQVEIQADPKSAENHIIPVVVKLQPQKPRKYTFGVGFATDTGARASAAVKGRRINRRGHNYNAGILVSQYKYGLVGEYLIPTGDPRTDAFGLRASYEDEHSDTRNFQAINGGGFYRFRDDLWIKTYALDYRIERFEQNDGHETSRLLIPSVDWTRTFPAELDKRIYAIDGSWLQIRLRGAYEGLISDTSFVQPLVSAKWIHSFRNKNRLIARGSAGTTWVDDFNALPTSLRFFSGGDRTIRGHKFSVIGPLDDRNTVIGGKHLTEVSLEYEFPIKEKWSLATFVDHGDAFNDTPDYKTGVGIGLRWRSPVGPVRIDLGHALEQPPGKNIRLHLTIGPDL